MNRRLACVLAGCFTSLCLLLVGCATRVRDPQSGRVVFETYADAQNITYGGPGYRMHADVLIHSTHTAKAIQSVGGAIGTAGAAVGTVGRALPR